VHWVVDLFAGRRNPAGRGNAATFDGTPALASFYVATEYLEAPVADFPENMKRALHAAAEAGHEIALHTHTHPHGSDFTSAQWAAEIDSCAAWLDKPFDAARATEAAVGLGVARGEQLGFRAPFLEYGPPLFAALRERGLLYDCSVETGFEDAYRAVDLPWPYRVAPGYGGGSDGDSAVAGRELWELPVYALFVPPDEACERYGVPPGLRARLHQVKDYFDPADGKITGFDWNLWVEFQMTAPEVLATLRYSLDQRLAGNRAPLTFGTHSDIYSEQYEGITGSTAEERRRTLVQFLDEALARPEVRVVSARQLLAWLRAPAAL
jgi:peptidoglycan/xylan/chitin deacetylase (PgdA/CDA1 family)